MNYSTEAPKRPPPYSAIRTPRGSVVVCAYHVVTEEVKDSEAQALAEALNREWKQRMMVTA